MKRRVNISALFNAQGCLTEEALIRYSNADVSAAERDQILKHVAGCTLCEEALKGIQLFESTAQFKEGVADLKQRWNKQQVKGKSDSRSAIAGITSIAASIVLLLGIYFFVKHQQEIRQQMIADMVEQGMPLSNGVNGGFELIPVNRPQLNDSRDNLARESYIKSETIPEKNVQPMAVLEESEVFASEQSYNGESPEKQRPQSKPLAKAKLHYPFRIMSMPPPEPMTIEYSEHYRLVEEMPVFRGGGAETFSDYISSQLQYPAGAIHESLEGKVYVQFVINERGTIQDINIVKSDHRMLNEEVIRVLRNARGWAPGRQGGKPVPVSMLLPVNFRLHK